MTNKQKLEDFDDLMEECTEYLHALLSVMNDAKSLEHAKALAWQAIWSDQPARDNPWKAHL